MDNAQVTQEDREALDTIKYCLRTATELRQSSGDCNQAMQAIFWENKALDTLARHRLERSEPVGCSAQPDWSDILDTIENAASNWRANGYATALAEVRDMANVGRALMDALPEGYHYCDCPSEVVADLQNQISEPVAEIERLRGVLAYIAAEAASSVSSYGEMDVHAFERIEKVAAQALGDKA